jgi:hypothetical protein
MRAWTYVFESPQWAMNLLFAVVSMFIPVIGPIIMNGYQFEIVEALHRRQSQTYPDFDFSRFADYLVRGVWVFLATLAISVIFMPVFLVLYFVGFGALFAAAAASGEEAAGAVFAIGVPILVIVTLFFTAPLAVVMIPLTLRAGLTQDFGATFRYDWIKDFIAKMWKEMFLGTLFLAATGTLVSLAGMALFCVGMYPAMALAFLAQAYMNFQYYDIYLQRGGEPIPLKAPQQQGW